MRKIVVLTAAVLTMALLATAVAAAERKAKDKAKPKADEKTAPCGCAAETKKGDTRDVICLMYQTMNFGSYCLYYALHVGCIDPVPYYGPCGMLGEPPVSQDCAGGSNCITTAMRSKMGVGKDRAKWHGPLAKDGFETKPEPKPRPGVLWTEAYIEFSKDHGSPAGKTLFAKILQVRMIPERFDPPQPGRPTIEDGNGFQVEKIPDGATVFSVKKKEVITIKRDVPNSPRLVNVLVNWRDNVWMEYNILLDKNEPPVDGDKAKRKREARVKK